LVPLSTEPSRAIFYLVELQSPKVLFEKNTNRWKDGTQDVIEDSPFPANPREFLILPPRLLVFQYNFTPPFLYETLLGY